MNQARAQKIKCPGEWKKANTVGIIINFGHHFT